MVILKIRMSRAQGSKASWLPTLEVVIGPNDAARARCRRQSKDLGRRLVTTFKPTTPSSFSCSKFIYHRRFGDQGLPLIRPDSRSLCCPRGVLPTPFRYTSPLPIYTRQGCTETSTEGSVWWRYCIHNSPRQDGSTQADHQGDGEIDGRAVRTLLAAGAITLIDWTCSVAGISAVPHDDNLRYFDVSIHGPKESPYEGASAIHIPCSQILTLCRWHIQARTFLARRLSYDTPKSQVLD